MAQKKIVVSETEEELLAKAQEAVSHSNWVVGECAAKWTQKYARGRTDADFASQVGMSADQVFQRRRVWETFADVYASYPSLKWSHFYCALNWDDSPECLQWAAENDATVAEMRAWRRALRGEDLSVESIDDQWDTEAAIRQIGDDRVEVREVGTANEAKRPGKGGAEGPAREHDNRLVGVAREAGGDDESYAPFRKGAASPAPKEASSGVAVADRPEMSAEQLLKRMTQTIERLNKLMTPATTREIRNQPDALRNRFVKAVGELSSKTAALM
jgi:hypothetical protein